MLEEQSETLDPHYAANLLLRRESLEFEARAVIEDLQLVSLLSRLGTPQKIGSFASGLMVWRDIDFCVISPRLHPREAFMTIQLLADHPRIHRVLYMNESGKFNPTGEPTDERFYFGVFYAPDQGDEWKIDVSFWLNDLPRPEIEDCAGLQRQLTHDTRLAILWLKEVWHRLPTYRTEVFSMDIYDAVLKHDIRTPNGFDRYLAELGKPGR